MQSRTLKRLLEQGERAESESQSRAEGQSRLEGQGRTGLLRQVARRAVTAVLHDPRVQDAAADLKGRVEELRGTARTQADLRLERLIEEHHARRGQDAPEEVRRLLAERRRSREAHAQKLRARQALLALAQEPGQRRVLARLARVTPWAGGTPDELRYTALLDLLAPSGDAGEEMAVHRALWTLAERRVLAVSPHGVITACPLPESAEALSRL